MGSEGTSPRLNLDTRWKLTASFTPQSLYPRRKDHAFPEGNSFFPIQVKAGYFQIGHNISLLNPCLLFTNHLILHVTLIQHNHCSWCLFLGLFSDVYSFTYVI